MQRTLVSSQGAARFLGAKEQVGNQEWSNKYRPVFQVFNEVIILQVPSMTGTGDMAQPSRSLMHGGAQWKGGQRLQCVMERERKDDNGRSVGASREGRVSWCLILRGVTR